MSWWKEARATIVGGEPPKPRVKVYTKLDDPPPWGSGRWHAIIDLGRGGNRFWTPPLRDELTAKQEAARAAEALGVEVEELK